MLQGPLLLNLADQEQNPPSCSSLPSSAGVSLLWANPMQAWICIRITWGLVKLRTPESYFPESLVQRSRAGAWWFVFPTSSQVVLVLLAPGPDPEQHRPGPRRQPSGPPRQGRADRFLTRLSTWFLMNNKSLTTLHWWLSKWQSPHQPPWSEGGESFALEMGNAGASLVAQWLRIRLPM